MQEDVAQIRDFDICIIGGGVVGIFLAIRFLASGKSVLLIEEGDQLGGQINLYKEKMIYNIPLIGEVKACDLLNNLKKQIQKFEKCKVMLSTRVLSLEKNSEGFVLKIAKDKDFIVKSKYVVLAFGKGRLEQNKLPLKNANAIEGDRLFYSIDNEEMFKNKELIITGGGDSVIDWACELVNIAKKITIIHRREINRLENPEFQHFQYLCKTKAITLKVPYNITELLINDNNRFGFKIVDKDKNEEKILCDYILAFYGLKTIQNYNNDIYKNLNVEIAEKGIVVDYKTNETKCDNLFAVGDCCCFDGKIYNIFMGFADAMRCFYEISHRENGKIDYYEHRN